MGRASQPLADPDPAALHLPWGWVAASMLNSQRPMQHAAPVRGNNHCLTQAKTVGAVMPISGKLTAPAVGEGTC